MKSFTPCLLAPIFIFSLLTLMSPLAPQSSALLSERAVADLIENTCKKTPYHDLCVASLRSYPNASDANVHDLARIMLDLTLANATDTLGYVEEMINTTKDPVMEKPLDVCAELYESAVKYIIPQAIGAFNKNGYGFAEYGLSVASNQADKCEKGFSKQAESPLSDRNSLVVELCGVAIAIIKIVQEG